MCNNIGKWQVIAQLNAFEAGHLPAIYNAIHIYQTIKRTITKIVVEVMQHLGIWSAALL